MTDYRGLPKEYTQVEYIQGAGKQHINTKFNPTSNTKVVADVELISQSSGSHACIFGSRSAASSTDSKSFCVWSMSPGTTIRSDFFGGNKTVSMSIVGKRVTIVKDKNICKVDNTTITNNSKTATSPYPMCLLGCNTGNVEWAYRSKTKLYSCQIYDNGTLKLDFVPAKRVSDNVIGMYDMVSKTFFTNAGIGVFTAGAEVKKRAAAYVGAPESIRLNSPGSFYAYFVDIQESDTSRGFISSSYIAYVETTGIELKAKEDFDISFDYYVIDDMLDTGIYNFYINSEFIGVYDVADGISLRGTWTGKMLKDSVLSIIATKTNANAVSNVLPRAPDRTEGIRCTLSNIQISTPSMPSVARKITKAYVGVLSDITSPINSTNFYKYFEYKGADGKDFKPTSDGTVSFYYSDRYRPDEFTEYEYVWTSLKKCTLRFDCDIWGEAADFTIDGVGQMIGSKSYTKDLDVGDTVTFYMAVNVSHISRAGETNLSVNITNIQISTPSMSSVARKITKAYIGVPTEIPIYEEQQVTKDVETLITPSNISNFFTVFDDAYKFVGDSSGKFTSNNKGYNSTTARSIWTAKKQIKKLTFKYKVSSERGYDEYRITVGGSIVANNISGEGIDESYSGSLASGKGILLAYIKDSSASANNDCGTIWDIKVTTSETVTEKVQIGTETKEVARLCYEAPPPVR